MKFSIVFAVFAVIFAIGFVNGFPSENTKKTSSIVINDEITISGLDYRPEHPLAFFPAFQRDPRCTGQCSCIGTSCKCSCSGCTLDQCIIGCTLAC